MLDERDTFSPFDEHPFRDELPERLLDLDAECAVLEAVARDNERRVRELRPLGTLAAQVFEAAAAEQRVSTLARTFTGGMTPSLRASARLLEGLERNEAASAHLLAALAPTCDMTPAMRAAKQLTGRSDAGFTRAAKRLTEQLGNVYPTEPSWQARLRELGAISDPSRATDSLLGQLTRQVGASVRATDSLLGGMRSQLGELDALERRAMLRAAPGKRGALRRRFRRARHELTVKAARRFYLELADHGPAALEQYAAALRRRLRDTDPDDRLENELALAWIDGTLAALAEHDGPPEARRLACQLGRTRSRIAARPRRRPRVRGSTRRRRPHLALTALQPHAPPALAGALCRAFEGVPPPPR